MRNVSVLAGVVAGVIALIGAPSAMAACALHRTPIVVTMKGTTPTVPVKIDGKDATFLVDSGSFFNMVSFPFATAHAMPRAKDNAPQIGSRLTGRADRDVSGVGGQVKTSTMVQAGAFALGGTDFGKAVFLTANTPEDGVIGQNLLSHWDTEYDFPNGAMKIVDAAGCQTSNLAYWVTTGSYSVMPLERLALGDKLTGGTVVINGVNMRAIFDTGANASFITRRAAARAGVNVTDPGVKEAGFTRGLDRDRIKTWVGRFTSVKIGDEEIKNGLLDIGQTDADDFDILIGADFFLAHHVYVANSQQKIYFSYSGGQVFNTTGQTGDSAAAK